MCDCVYVGNIHTLGNILNVPASALLTDRCQSLCLIRHCPTHVCEMVQLVASVAPLIDCRALPPIGAGTPTSAALISPPWSVVRSVSVTLLISSLLIRLIAHHPRLLVISLKCVGPFRCGSRFVLRPGWPMFLGPPVATTAPMEATNADIWPGRPLTSFLRAWMSSLWVAVVSGGDTSPRPSGVLRKAWRVAGLAVIKFLLAGSMLCQAISTLASSFRPIASASSRRVDIKSVRVWPARCCVKRKACSLAHLAEEDRAKLCRNAARNTGQATFVSSGNPYSQIRALPVRKLGTNVNVPHHPNILT